MFIEDNATKETCDPGWGHIISLHNIFYKHSMPPASIPFDIFLSKPEGLYVYRNAEGV